MRYCPTCGSEVNENAVICVKCGCALAPQNKAVANGGNDGLSVAIKVFLILSCVVQGFLILPLAWCLPIAISIFGKMKRCEPIGVGLKICALLFVNTIAGILLLCRNDEA